MVTKRFAVGQRVRVPVGRSAITGTLVSDSIDRYGNLLVAVDGEGDEPTVAPVSEAQLTAA